jgi:histidine triad (HIT) family protein
MALDCVFCKIGSGDLPSTKVYEDELVVAFLDIAPLNKGHVLVIPREHCNSITTVPPQQQARMMEVGAKLGAALMRVTDGDGFNLLVSTGACAGQIVPHAHLHVIPRHGDDGITFTARTIQYDSEAEKQDLAAKVIQRLKS